MSNVYLLTYASVAWKLFLLYYSRNLNLNAHFRKYSHYPFHHLSRGGLQPLRQICRSVLTWQKEIHIHLNSPVSSCEREKMMVMESVELSDARQCQQTWSCCRNMENAEHSHITVVPLASCQQWAKKQSLLNESNSTLKNLTSYLKNNLDSGNNTSANNKYSD